MHFICPCLYFIDLPTLSEREPTFLYDYDKQIIREAILREILRGGQVYFLHDKVDTIQKVSAELQQWIPEAKIAVAHGQMRERELEHIMANFQRRRYNVLVCTTIIETGLDIPNANTIIIRRADTLGLAQLHQLRGRVGRSHHQAYAYLLVPSKKLLSKNAEKRLEAITTLEDLGMGFTLATHDMEIRGAGELLGEEQSGHIQAVGFELYMEMLERAAKSLQSNTDGNLSETTCSKTEIDLHICNIIPNDYLPDPHTRLIFYKRIASAKDNSALDDIRAELIDRFGLLPEPAQYLFRIATLKLQAHILGISKIQAHGDHVTITFVEKPNIDAERMLTSIQKHPKVFQLAGPNKLRIQFADKKPDTKIQTLTDWMANL